MSIKIAPDLVGKLRSLTLIIDRKPAPVAATFAFADDEITPHDGHAAAASQAVWTCTSRAPSGSGTTRSTRTPANPNSNVVPLLKLVASPGLS